MDEKKPEVKSDIDLIYSAVMADTDALEDAKMALEIIKETDPGVYDEMINDTLSSINYALSNSILSAVDRLADPFNQEPAAWMHTSAMGHVYFRKNPQDAVFNPQPLYLDPLRREWEGLTIHFEKREWVGMTNDELLDIADMVYADDLELLQNIQAKLKEKNDND
jgi:hypothetical protein